MLKQRFGFTFFNFCEFRISLNFLPEKRKLICSFFKGIIQFGYQP